jgi:hypothetical protein
MNEREDREQAGAPQPEQVAAATTQTGPNQENARTLRTTEGLRAGGPPVPGESPAEEPNTSSGPVDPADLVRTEGERVPPPDRTRP